MNSINMIIDSLNIVNVTEDDSARILNFDYVKTDSDMAEMRLRPSKIDISRYDAQLTIGYPDNDAEITDMDDQIINFYLKVITDEMLSAAHFAADLNIVMSEPNSGRRLMSKLISASSMIAVRCRRGPGNFAIMSSANFKSLPVLDGGTKLFLHAPTIFGLVGIQIYLCDSIGDTVLVGRKGKSDEPGIFFKSDEIMVHDYTCVKDDKELVQDILDGKYAEAAKNRISHVNLRFAIDAVGEPQPYVAFNAFNAS